MVMLLAGRVVSASIGLLLLAAACVGAFSLHASVDSMSLECVDGTAYAWVSGPDTDEGTLFISVSSADFNVEVSNSRVDLASGQKGSAITFASPRCFRGSDWAVVTAKICGSGGKCAVEKKSIRVEAYPCGDCNSGDYRYDWAQDPNYASGKCTGENCEPLYSTYSSRAYFEPAQYDVAVSVPEDCASVSGGELSRFKISLLNYGNSAEFSLRAIAPESVSASLSSEKVFLSRSEVKDVFLDVVPSDSASGRKTVKIAVLVGGVLVSEESICIHAVSRHAFEIAIASEIKVPVCGSNTVPLSLSNLGSSSDTYFLSAENAEVAPSVSVGAGKEEAVSVRVFPGSSGSVSVKSGNSGVSRTASFKIGLFECAENSKVDVSSTPSGRDVEVFFRVKNSGSLPLEDVSLSVSGIPEDWVFDKTPPFAVQPGAVENALVAIKPKTGEQKTALVELVSNGQILASEKVEINAPSNPISGFFVVIFSSTILTVLFALAIALAAVLVYARIRSGGQEKDGGFNAQEFSDMLESERVIITEEDEEKK